MDPDTTHSKKKTIGLLGGMGPAASASMYQELIKKAQAQYGASLDCDFPAIMLYSLPLVDWDTTGFRNLESVKNQLIAGIQTLEKAGVDFIILGCNTVHYFYEEMQAAVKKPIINMVTKTAETVKESEFTKVGVLATDSSNRLGVYRSELAKQGIDLVALTPEEQRTVTTVISHVEDGSVNAMDTRDLKLICTALALRGAEAIILGCTELPLVIKQSQSELKLFNSADIILNAALEEAYGRKPQQTQEKAPACLSDLKPVVSEGAWMR